MLTKASIMEMNSRPIYRICLGSKVARNPNIFFHSVLGFTPFPPELFRAAILASRANAYGTVFSEGLTTFSSC
jgi:hypothetical protein